MFKLSVVKHIGVSFISLLVMMVPLDSSSAEAQSGVENYTARSASVPGPKTLPPLAARALAPPMSQAEVDLREQQLGKHHLPTPIGITPAADLARALPPPPAQTLPGTMAITVPFDMNRGLTDAETSGLTSTVNEPSVASRGNEVLMTGNWFAAFSTDAGASFTYVNPANTFPSASNGFCCDQVAIYDPDHDLMAWFLQYISDANGENTIRIAVAQGADIPTQQWRYYDFTPQGVGGWNNQWFDYPDLAVGNENLYITTNTFSAANVFTRSVILRIPLSELAAYQPLNFDSWDTTQHGSLRLSQGADDIMYFASHNNTGSIRVFSWPEASPNITFSDVAVTVWPGNGARPGWTGRSGSRITAGWLANGELGFGWTASAGGGFAHPHVRFAVIDVNTMNVVNEPHLWNQNFPFAYPAAAPNGTGRVGLGVHFGTNPNHAVGVLEQAGWQLEDTAASTHSPASNTWGDYASVRAHGSDPNAWVATGFTLDGGANRQDIVVRYIHFREGTPPPPVTTPQITIQVEDPNRKLKDGDSMWVRASVTINGSPAANRNVTFSSASINKLSVAPASISTNAQGVAQATLTSHTSGSNATVAITATDDASGETATTTVKVPDLSYLGFVLLLSLLLLLGLLYKRRSMV